MTNDRLFVLAMAKAWRRLLLAVVLLGEVFTGAACTDTNAVCANIPVDVQAYLQSEPGWSVVELKDLVEDDQRLWEQYHRGLWPGIAIADLDGSGDKAYALALLNRIDGQSLEKVVVLRKQSLGLTVELLVPPDVTPTHVVWKVGPGVFPDRETDQTVTTTHDAIIYERMEATATLYYYEGGTFRSVLTSD